MVTTGPGGTNAVTGVAGAWLDSTPCLFLSGQVKRADLKGDTGVRQLGVQEIDIVSMVRSITKYAVTVMDPQTIRYHLEKALHLATIGRPGPVWIDIPARRSGRDNRPCPRCRYGSEPPNHGRRLRDCQRRVAMYRAAQRRRASGAAGRQRRSARAVRRSDCWP